MELSVLNSNFKRSRLVESWNSLIWTERYSSNGEFELHSSDIGSIMRQLPQGGVDDPPCLVAIDDSDVPMIVENHKLEKEKNGTPKVVVSGRSFESVLDRRATIKEVTSGVKRVEWRIPGVNAATAAYEVAKRIVVENPTIPHDVIPEIALFNSVVEAGVTQEFPVEPKELYAWLIDTLVLGKYGLKSQLSSTLTNQIALIIYKGTDRRTSVVFDVALEAFEEASYLLSKVGYKNTMITATANGMEFSNTGVERSGLARRVDFQDLSSEITVPVGTDLTNLTVNKGKVALASRLPTALFSGGVAVSIGEEYNKKYFLGDIVHLQGEYGLSQDARVAEFVRTQDTTGEKAYPTFEAVNV